MKKNAVIDFGSVRGWLNMAPRSAAPTNQPTSLCFAYRRSRRGVPTYELSFVSPLLACAERDAKWKGKVTLLEKDMRRIGVELADTYCKALRRSEDRRRDNNFGKDTASIREIAA